ncbi:MAG: tetratricopeptide repeat protein, partial [Candidatus Eisenbacteria bacterium]|nr:tetratricopeptide repeat protein [Candidatus Eisenbacteria bacterium]
FMLATTQHRIGKLSFAWSSTAGAQRAIGFLNQVEALAPNLQALYEYRSTYWDEVGNTERADADAARAEVVKPSTWLDHWLLANKFWPDQQRAIAELEKAIALKVDDYWTWYAWGLAFEWAEEFAERRIHHAMSICINLNPLEAAGWIGRGAHGMLPEPSGREAAIADLTRGLELTDDPGLRSFAHYYRGVALSAMGDMDGALRDLSSAVEAKSNFPGCLVTRGELYLMLGDKSRAQADFREVLVRFPRPAKPSEYIWRIRALKHLEEWETVIEECHLQAAHPDNIFNNQTNVAYADYRLGRYQEAAQILQNATGAAESFVLSMALWKMGRKEEARASYRRGVDWIARNGSAVLSGSRVLWCRRVGAYESEAAGLSGISESQRPDLFIPTQ